MFKYIDSVFLILISIFLFLLFQIGNYSYSYVKMKSWKTTIGTVVSREKVQSGGNTNVGKMPLITINHTQTKYRYTVDFTTFYGKGSIKNKYGTNIGAPVMVRYNPNNPENHSAENKFNWIQVLLWLLFSSPFLILALSWLNLRIIYQQKIDEEELLVAKKRARRKRNKEAKRLRRFRKRQHI